MHTILISFTSFFGMFPLITRSDRDVFINHLPTHRAKSHWSVCVPVIQVGTFVSPRYHSSLLSIYDHELSRSYVILLSSLISVNGPKINIAFATHFHRCYRHTRQEQRIRIEGVFGFSESFILCRTLHFNSPLTIVWSFTCANPRITELPRTCSQLVHSH